MHTEKSAWKQQRAVHELSGGGETPGVKKTKHVYSLWRGLELSCSLCLADSLLAVRLRRHYARSSDNAGGAEAARAAAMLWQAG